MTIVEQRFYWAAGDTMSVHYDAIELHCRLEPYVVAARSWIEPGDEYPLGRLSLLPVGRRFHARAGMKNEEVRTICCQFDRNWFRTRVGMEIDWDAVAPGTLLDFHHPHIERAMRRLAEEIVRPGEHSEAMSLLLCQSIGIDLVRFFSRSQETEATLAPAQMNRIKELLATSDDPLPSAAGIADELGLSLGHLRRLFRKTTGQTLHDFIEEARFAKACALLIETRLPLKVISFLTGFGRHSTFSFAFKRKMGQSPTEYRRALQ